MLHGLPLLALLLLKHLLECLLCTSGSPHFLPSPLSAYLHWPLASRTYYGTMACRKPIHCKKNRVEWGRKLFPRVDIVRVRVEISYLQLFNPSKGRFSYPGLWVGLLYSTDLGACTLLGIGGSKETEGGRVHDLGGMSFENGGAWGPIPTIFDENGACFFA